MRQLISATCLTILLACPPTNNHVPPAVIGIAVAVVSANGASAGSPEQACAVLASVALLSDQELTFKWNNTCGFPVILKWRSRSHDGRLITGTLTLPPHQSGADKCTRCALPEWTESWHNREA